ncbi:MAG: hypothetical protein IPJ75_01245 [Ignavibacteriales bacterium]|nr:hypothetical protein [Ignavibacteriales bacterium]
MISAISRTEAFALTVLPLVLIPMVIFAGLVEYFGQMQDSVQWFSGLWLSRWAYELSLITAYDRGVEILGFNYDGSVIAFVVITFMLITFTGGLVWKLMSMDKRK